VFVLDALDLGTFASTIFLTTATALAGSLATTAWTKGESQSNYL
jgi:hypothetical protein